MRRFDPVGDMRRTLGSHGELMALLRRGGGDDVANCSRASLFATIWKSMRDQQTDALALPRRVRAGWRAQAPAQPPTVRLRTLVWVRWLALAGQAAAVLVASQGLGLRFDSATPLTVIAAGAVVNALILWRASPAQRLTDRAALGHLLADLGQLLVLLALTGGAANPFIMLLAVPVTLSAMILPRRYTGRLVLAALVGSAAITLWHRPLPWDGPDLALPALYIAGMWAAAAVTICFLALYVGAAAADARRRDRAMASLERSLAAERELSALGGLAAAAAHELGTPLGTIKLAARDLLRELPEDHPLQEEARLIDSQAARCRDILKRLSQARHLATGHLEETSLEALLREVASPFEADDVDIRFECKAEGAAAPAIPRRPEILQALTNFIENAVDFARSTVIIAFAWDETAVRVDILDDGPGFDRSILSRLGEPYLSSRREGSIDQAEAHGAGGLGLGIFIAKTLLERTGATVRFVNRPTDGAKVQIHWPRAIF